MALEYNMSGQVPMEVIYAYFDYVEDLTECGEFLEVPSAREFCKMYLEELNDFIAERDRVPNPKEPTPPTNPFGFIS